MTNPAGGCCGDGTDRSDRQRGGNRFRFAGAALVVAVIVGLHLSTRNPTPEPKNLDPKGLLREPSGITFHPVHQTLIAVGDEGDLVELEMEGNFLSHHPIGGDLEGVTVDPDRGLLYVLDERSCRLVLLDWEGFERVTEIDLRPILEKAGVESRKNNGLEGIVYTPTPGRAFEGTLWLAHQRKPALLLKLKVTGREPVFRFLESRVLPAREVSGLASDLVSGDLLVISDREDRLFRIRPEGTLVRSMSLPGSNQEGIVTVPQGGICLADDSGGIYWFPSLSP